MKVYELFTKEALNEALAQKLVKVEKHPTLDLYIYNYTANTQFAWVWNDVTLNCRGLIVDGEDNIVARPFKKFFSYEQLDGKLPEGNFVVEEKMDGSMLIVVNYKGNIVTATRGSFVSEQARDAHRFINKENFLSIAKEGIAFIFEYISKWNRIVVDYDYEGLVYLTAIHASGEETYYREFYRNYMTSLGYKFPKIYSFDSLEEILSYEEPNLEGFVLRYKNGERVKIKLEDYKRLHRLITGVSEKTVWEAMRNGTLDELLEGTPDEFYDFVTEVKDELTGMYEDIESYCKIAFRDIGDRKENALYYQTTLYPAILFKMLDRQDYSDIIWKLVRPEVTRVFKMVSEDAN